MACLYQHLEENVREWKKCKHVFVLCVFFLVSLLYCFFFPFHSSLFTRALVIIWMWNFLCWSMYHACEEDTEGRQADIEIKNQKTNTHKYTHFSLATCTNQTKNQKTNAYKQTFVVSFFFSFTRGVHRSNRILTKHAIRIRNKNL